MRRISAAFTDPQKARNALEHLGSNPQMKINIRKLSVTDPRLHQQDVGFAILYGVLIGTIVGLLVGFVGFFSVGGSLGNLLLISTILGMVNGAVIGSVVDAGTKRSLAHQIDMLRKNGALLIDVQAEDVFAETEAYQQFTRNQGVILQSK
ncbi:hypothetical protein [Deinococcus cellulosilyticus]|uniref:DUF1269 domain-containing protein n=1 Tax=Deinococcus cellulosilyticus (strain DSM 18568 / NBRC 106333 / KACC 11606 / 5516J-15) TaxID=1223518 RepID=A0A511N138_DEIC1|nr:hypothetical protein [Deinococcus cellulosilyticus]GEM46582.1 hypothetical protein DC3_22170 [Deinococcus cellulosilyticus NBRC 106333 = KACC 11606]